MDGLAAGELIPASNGATTKATLNPSNLLGPVWSQNRAGCAVGCMGANKATRAQKADVPVAPPNDDETLDISALP